MPMYKTPQDNCVVASTKKLLVFSHQHFKKPIALIEEVLTCNALRTKKSNVPA